MEGARCYRVVTGMPITDAFRASGWGKCCSDGARKKNGGSANHRDSRLEPTLPCVGLTLNMHRAGGCCSHGTRGISEGRLDGRRTQLPGCDWNARLTPTLTCVGQGGCCSSTGR